MTFLRTVFLLILALLAGCHMPESHVGTLPSSARTVDDFISKHTGNRTVFIQLPQGDFSTDSIAAIVDMYRRECTPRDLRVVVFSDSALLTNRIELDRNPIAVDFAYGDEGRKAAERYWQRTHWPAGTYIADYERDFAHEAYTYRLSRDDVPRTTVDLSTSARKVCE